MRLFLQVSLRWCTKEKSRIAFNSMYVYLERVETTSRLSHCFCFRFNDVRLSKFLSQWISFGRLWNFQLLDVVSNNWPTFGLFLACPVLQCETVSCILYTDSSRLFAAGFILPPSPVCLSTFNIPHAACFPPPPRSFHAYWHPG